MASIQTALELSPNHTDAWHLLALLFSAQGDFAQALRVCEVAVSDNPDRLDLLMTKAALLDKVQGGTGGLVAYQQAFAVWKRLFGSVVEPLDRASESNVFVLILSSRVCSLLIGTIVAPWIVNRR